jgi:hypothetical protein
MDKEQSHRVEQLIDEQLDLVAGGVYPGHGLSTAISAGGQPHVPSTASLNAPQQAPISVLNSSVIVAEGLTNAGGPSNPSNPSNNAFRP